MCPSCVSEQSPIYECENVLQLACNENLHGCIELCSQCSRFIRTMNFTIGATFSWYTTAIKLSSPAHDHAASSYRHPLLIYLFFPHKSSHPCELWCLHPLLIIESLKSYSFFFSSSCISLINRVETFNFVLFLCVCEIPKRDSV